MSLIRSNLNMAVFYEIPLVKQIGFTASEMAVFEKYISVEKFAQLLRFGQASAFYGYKPDLFLCLPQVYITSYFNISPETFSSLKRKLK